MSQQLGATYTLSVLVVLCCAVAFYRPEKPAPAPPAGRAKAEDARPVKTPPSAERPRPAGDATVARVAPPPAHRTEVTPPARPEVTAAASAEVPAPEKPRAVARKVPRPTETRGAFAHVEPGETLADVAARVYGSAAKVDLLWRSNRDQVRSPDSPLAAGTLLRTP